MAPEAYIQMGGSGRSALDGSEISCVALRSSGLGSAYLCTSFFVNLNVSTVAFINSLTNVLIV